ncbi:MAG: helicase-related protein [Bacteroidales bacterium]|nr:phospholipase D-like domain-containing protein [Bacteroidales bacterium]
MSSNFITNNTGQKSLKSRLNTLISISEELKFLVGFFYFSGWKEVYESLKANENITVRLLVGLQVDKFLYDNLIEHGIQEDRLSNNDRFNGFVDSLRKALNSDDSDMEAFYNQVFFFLEMIEQGRLNIRKTKNPNHAKLYLFKLNQQQTEIQGMKGQFITGSSNLTSAGLSGQEEFNVEIKDYGYEDADAYFEALWAEAAPITEIPSQRNIIIDLVGTKTLAAKVTPYEAYALILKTYLDLQQTMQISSSTLELLKNNGYKEFAYQVDAVNQGLSILEEYKGVVIADVVGLGKSVIASLIAKYLDKRTMIICPPGLIGEKNIKEPSGWYEYMYNFQLTCEIESRGKLVEIAESIDNRNIEVVIIDEAHYYRNQDTDDYEALLKICRDRIVILLTATPFNNSPADIFSLLKLFIVPGKSGITIDNDLNSLFVGYGNRFKKLSEISRFSNSHNVTKRDKATKYYIELFGENRIDLVKVREETKRLANQIKNVISPVIIRRNRLDLKNDYLYSQEVTELSEVQDPIELFYNLNTDQSKFYDRVLTEYFGEDGEFTGAIYQPFKYETEVKEGKLDEEGNRAAVIQSNLFDFMRRLLVKRFESSFGAFNDSINRFVNIHIRVKEFIDKTNGKYILDRKLMNSLMEEEDMDIILRILDEYENNMLSKRVPKNNTVYDINKFKRKSEFIENINKDIALFEKIKAKLDQLDIVHSDPKRMKVSEEVDNILQKNKDRKVIIFTEYTDTVKHLEGFFKAKYNGKVLICDGGMTATLHHKLNANFNAQFKGERDNDYDILITSDKLSEGFNLNRAGVIINYDIPWNPTRVIQRVGRINRIGSKVFDELFIYNFFPSEAGSGVVQIREIAMQKMFLIHNALGEDSKIFDPNEEPTPAMLFNKVNENPDIDGEQSVGTQIRNKYFEIEQTHPEIIKKIADLPTRVKSGKPFSQNQVCVLRRKGLSLFTHLISDTNADKLEVSEITFEEFLDLVECEFDTPQLMLSSKFWKAYNEVKDFKTTSKKALPAKSLEAKAFENLKCSLKLLNHTDDNLINFIKVLITDIDKYKTLSDRTLGRLARNPLNIKSPESEIKTFKDEVLWIKNSLGADYLDRILKRIEHQKNEVVIAVENMII